MGFFDKLFGQTKPSVPPATAAAPPAAAGSDLLTRYAGMALDKQSQLQDVYGDIQRWDVDLDAGKIYLDGHEGIAVQAIGSFAYGDSSWLWAWGNQASDLPEAVLADVARIRQYGQQHGIGWLNERSFPSTFERLHEIGAAAVGLCGADAYYLGDYGQGVLLMNLYDDKLKQAHTNSPHLRTLSMIPQLVSVFELPDHRAAVRHYLQDKGYRLTETDRQLSAERADGGLVAEFDAQGRLSGLNSRMQPS